MPYISAIPGAIVLIIGFSHVLDYYLRRWRPKWTTPFVAEYPLDSRPSSLQGAKRRLGWALCLLAVSTIGLATQIAQLVPPGLDSAAIILTISWVSISAIDSTTGPTINKKYRQLLLS